MVKERVLLSQITGKKDKTGACIGGGDGRIGARRDEEVLQGKKSGEKRVIGVMFTRNFGCGVLIMLMNQTGREERS